MIRRHADKDDAIASSDVECVGTVVTRHDAIDLVGDDDSGDSELACLPDTVFVGVFEDGEDDFWLVDAAIRYRFPKRYGFLTVGVRNLFDKDFEYYDTDFDNPAIQPDRVFFATITLALP